jgi:polyketide biosynthesis enoyl-CoA hydratase PksI
MTTTGNPVQVQISGHIAAVRMADESGRNRFNPGLSRGVIEGFARVVADPEVSVVLLLGLPDVFSGGATEGDLLDDRTDSLRIGYEVLSTVADCPVPVIAAARGHAIGGGLSLMLSADMVVLSDRARYSANFIGYGFTPPLSSRVIMTAWLGAPLAAEMLYTGRAYAGRELAGRAPAVRVVASEHVESTAYEIAQRVAMAPRRTLELLKAQLVRRVRGEVREAEEQSHSDHFASYDPAAVRQGIESFRDPRVAGTAGDSLLAGSAP